MPDVSQYLPELPSIPDIPLPEPLDKARSHINFYDGQYVSPLIQRLNYVILIFSFCAISSSSLANFFVFKPSMILSVGKKSADQSSIPFLWTLVTSVFVESNIILLVIHFITINYVVIKNRKSLESAWQHRDFIKMLCISAFLSTMTHFVFRLSIYKMTGNAKNYNSFEYCSINFIVIALLLGLRQQANKQVLSNMSELQEQTETKEFDSGVPFISGNIIIPYSILPQLYIVASLSVSFLFEQPFDLRILLDFFWIWFYLRFFMRSNVTQVGDFTPEFAMHTFFPQKLKGPVKIISEVAYAMFNMCGFINWMQRYQQGLPAPEPKSQQFE